MAAATVPRFVFIRVIAVQQRTLESNMQRPTLNVQSEKAGDSVDEEREDDGVEAKGKHAVHQR
jgi:hypothetical protein